VYTLLRGKFGTTTGLLANRNLVLDILKAWYIDWLPVKNPQAKKKERKKVSIPFPCGICLTTGNHIKPHTIPIIKLHRCLFISSCGVWDKCGLLGTPLKFDDAPWHFRRIPTHVIQKR